MKARASVQPRGERWAPWTRELRFGNKSHLFFHRSCCCAQGKIEQREEKKIHPKLEARKASTHQRQRAEVAEVTTSQVRRGCGRGVDSVGLDARAVAAAAFPVVPDAEFTKR